MLNNFLKQDQKPITLEKLIKLLRIEMNPQKIYSDWIADSNSSKFESIRINFKISSVNAIPINLEIFSYSVLNPNEFTLV